MRLSYAGEVIKHNRFPVFLGVTLDESLCMARHCEKMEAAMRTRLNVVRRLAGTSWGGSRRMLRSVHVTYCQAKGDYALAAYGPLAADSGRAKLDGCQAAAASVITGCAKHSNVYARLREAEIEPFTTRLKSAAAREHEKYHRLPEAVPAHRTARRQDPQGGQARAWRAVARKALEDTGLEEPRERAPTHAVAPTEPRGEAELFPELIGPPVTRQDAPEVRKAATLRTLAALPRADLAAWTDGAAQDGVRRGGGGYVVYRGEEIVTAKAVAAGLHCSSYRAEMVALRDCLRKLETLPAQGKAGERNTIRVCTDSQSAVRKLRAGPARQKVPLAQ